MVLAEKQSPHRVVVIGGGFGGLYAAKALGNAPVQVTLIDKRNFHLFQPLLYQVATGSLSPADIASPLRGILSHHKNTQVLMQEAIDIDPQQQKVIFPHGEIEYDTLVVATGVSHHYFGNDVWQSMAPGLKTVEDALEVRRRILMAFEAAEKETDPQRRRAWLTFAIVGGGPTGVEMAGAIADLAFDTLKHDFRQIDTSETQILLLEGLDRILSSYPPELSAEAVKSLTELGVTVQTNTLVTNIADDTIEVRQGDRVERIASRTMIWAAGVKASAMGEVLAKRTGVKLDRVGRAIVASDLSIPDYPNIFVIGDLAHCVDADGKPLPGIAPVAIQEGQYLAKLVKQRLQGNSLPPFKYQDVGSLAVIGHKAAVVDLGAVKLAGPIAWLIWVFAHIYYLIEFDNKLIVLMQWGWNYFTRKQGARLITGKESLEDAEFSDRKPSEDRSTVEV
jgi:NADH:ubiquinone reductase (H+-translocating)